MPKFKISRVLEIKDHEIESKAFSKSISIIRPSIFCVLHSFIISYIKRVFSPMNLLFTKPFWSGCINFGSNFFILSAIILE